MVIKYIESGEAVGSSFYDKFVPMPGDAVVIGDAEYLVESRKVDCLARVVYVNVKRVRNEVED